MPIAITGDHRALADAVGSWASRVQPVSVARAMETDAEGWRSLWPAVADLGVPGSALPAPVGGGGGSVADLAVLLEACARALVPGPLLTTALAGVVLAEAGGHDALVREIAGGDRPCAVALAGADVQACREGAELVLSGTVRPVSGIGDLLVPAQYADGETIWCIVAPGNDGAKRLELPAGDFSRPLGEMHLDDARARPVEGMSTERIRALAATFAAAEASGVAAWCLNTAVEYAKVREQFGHPIGSFQAVKHLCATMLCRAETAAAVAWDAARSADDPAQHEVAAAVAASLALDAAVDNAKDCIQVLGGIGFTWEHDAHLYLRRAVALRQLVGGSTTWRRTVADLTTNGARRELTVELGTDIDRAGVREQAEHIAATPDAERRRVLADSGYLMPHWPRPYGLDAGPELQLLVDEELERAGVTRPDLVIAGWAIPTILRHGSAEQVERFVAPTLHGEITWCQLFSEPGAGSDLAALRTRAERVEGGWSLTGQKVWTSLADRADWGVCLARTNRDTAGDAPKHRGITYFLVDMRSAGLDVRPLREITGEPAFNEVFLDAVFVPDDLIVGEVDAGWPLARTTLSHERVAMGGGSSIGDSVERLVRAATDLGALDDALVRDRVGALVADGLAGSLLDLRTTLRRLGGSEDDGAAASVRKLIGVRHRQEVAEAALDLVGVDGLLAGEELQNMLLTRCLSIAGGTTQILLTMAGERILGLPRG